MLMASETGVCKRCESEIGVGLDACPECGNNPFKDGVRGIGGFGLIMLVVSILFPPFILLGIGLLLSAFTLWAFDKAGLDYWGDWYSPTKRDWGVLK